MPPLSDEGESEQTGTSCTKRQTTSDQDVSPSFPRPGTAFACGLGAGVIQAGLLNPYDRALYLSVKHRRAFLTPENFMRPYLGFAQSVGGRALSGGLFFPLETLFQSLSVPNPESSDSANFLIGSAAGSVNALLLNPLSAIKYRTWGRDNNRGMMSEALHMWKKAGIRPFFHGFLPTVARDLVFGGCYTLIRFHLRDSRWTGSERQWTSNMGAAAIATVASGPFNLARNIQYATGTTKPRPTIVFVLKTLWREAAAKPGGLMARLSFLQNRLRIGWGTFRVAAGMALGQQVYDTLFNAAKSW